MLPIVLDLRSVRVALAGNGELALRRLSQLAEEGGEVSVYAPAASEALVRAAGDLLLARLPTEAELRGLRLLFIGDLESDQKTELAGAARAAGVLVNTEDHLPLCDFHMPAIVRRGDLMLAVSTGGASPTLARLLKQRLESEFGEDWSGRVNEIAEWRRAWRAQGLSASEISAHTHDALIERGWLS